VVDPVTFAIWWFAIGDWISRVGDLLIGFADLLIDRADDPGRLELGGDLTAAAWPSKSLNQAITK
jgi:hypothetical protein